MRGRRKEALIAAGTCQRGHLWEGGNLYTTSRGYKGCRVCNREKSQAWAAANPERAREMFRACYYKTKYGLKRGDKAALLERQGGQCPICLKPLALQEVRVDHDHKSGRVRGLLHNFCNVAVVAVAENYMEDLGRARAYLESA